MKRVLFFSLLFAFTLAAGIQRTTQKAAPRPGMANTVITFEDLAPGTRVINQYLGTHGVSFRESRIITPASGTASGTRALETYVSDNEFDPVPQVIQFTGGQSLVRMSVGLSRTTTFQVTASLKAFDAGGNQIGTTVTTTLGSGVTAINKPIEVTSTQANIRRVELNYQAAGSGNFFFEALDDLEFSSVVTPPIDTQAPVIQITKPTPGEAVYIPFFQLNGTIQEASALADVRLTIESAGQAATTFQIDYSGNAPQFTFGGSTLLGLLSPGSNTVTVRATDIFNNTGQASVKVNFAQTMTNLWAQALEVTQATQPYVPENPVRRSGSGVPRFVYPSPSVSSLAVPLVANRTTVARFYAGVEATPNNASLVNVNAFLYCFTDDTYTTPCAGPLVANAVNQPPNSLSQITVRPGDTLDDKRRDARLSWNFILPDAWVKTGDIYLEAKVEAPNISPECGGCVDDANRIRLSRVPFSAVPNYQNNLVHLVSIRRQSGTNFFEPTQQQIDNHTDFMLRRFPIDEATAHTAVNETWTHQDDVSQPSATRCWDIHGKLAAAFPKKGGKLAVYGISDQLTPCAGIGGGGIGYGGALRPDSHPHEVGHAVGLNHAGPSPGHGAECAGWPCDEDWPYPHGGIGAFGFDTLSMMAIDPATGTTNHQHDFMSYGSPVWVSPRNWTRMFNAFTNSALPYPKQISTPVETLAVAASPAQLGNFLLVRGRFVNREWNLLPVYELELAEGSGGAPGEGTHSIELLNSRGAVLYTRRFTPYTEDIRTDDPNVTYAAPPSFSETLPLPDGVTAIVLRAQGNEVVRLLRSANVPRINVISPTARGFIGQPDNPVIRWEGDDADRQVLRYAVQYRRDGGDDTGWRTLANDWLGNELAVNLLDLPGGTRAQVRVLATDGFNTRAALSPFFTVANKPPRVRILIPGAATGIRAGDPLTLRGTGSDTEDGLLDLNELEWSSSLDGALGRGRRLEVTTLSLGVHEITLLGFDSDRNRGTATVTVVVFPKQDPNIKIDFLSLTANQLCSRSVSHTLRFSWRSSVPGNAAVAVGPLTLIMPDGRRATLGARLPNAGSMELPLDFPEGGVLSLRLDVRDETGGTNFVEREVELRSCQLTTNRNLRVADATFVRGQVNALNVELIAQGDENLVAFSLQYDRDLLTYVSAERGSDAANARLRLDTSQTTEGRLGISLALPPGERFAAGLRALAIVRLQAARTDATATTINFVDQPIRRGITDVNNETLAANYSEGTLVFANAVACVSAASFTLTPMAPESIVAAFGQNMATSTAAAATVPLPTTLAGTTVRVRDSAGAERLAPLFFVSAGQVNYLLPAGTANGAATITVTSGDGTVALGRMTIATVAPGLFTANANGMGVAAAVALRVKADGSQVYEFVSTFDAAQQRYVPLPLSLGPEGEQLYLLLFGTGVRNYSNLANVQAQVGGVSTPVPFVGGVEGLVGLDQLNVGPLPRSLAGRGEVNIAVQVDGQAANVVTVSLR